MAIWGFVGLITQYVIVPLLTKFGIHDAAIGLMSVTGAAVESLMVAFAKETWILYLGN